MNRLRKNVINITFNVRVNNITRPLTILYPIHGCVVLTHAESNFEHLALSLVEGIKNFDCVGFVCHRQMTSRVV